MANPDPALVAAETAEEKVRKKNVRELLHDKGLSLSHIAQRHVTEEMMIPLMVEKKLEYMFLSPQFFGCVLTKDREDVYENAFRVMVTSSSGLLWAARYDRNQPLGRGSHPLMSSEDIVNGPYALAAARLNGCTGVGLFPRAQGQFSFTHKTLLPVKFLIDVHEDRCPITTFYLIFVKMVKKVEVKGALKNMGVKVYRPDDLKIPEPNSPDPVGPRGDIY